MKYARLGKTDITVSTVAMGCWAFAGGDPWGPQEDADSIAAVHAALELGVNFFDTAEGYGDGRSESVLGRALGGRRDEAIVATKVSASHLSRTELPAACERSLKRLRTDHIDLYQIHWPNPGIPIAESIEALVKLRDEGKVRAIGVCNFGVEQLSDLLDVGLCETNQLSYSLIWRALEYELRPLCLEKGVGIICWGPLSEGLLTGKFASPGDVPGPRAATRHFSSSRPHTRHGEPGFERETFAAIDRIRQVAARIGQPMAVVSLAWLLHQPGVTAVLAGSRRPAQIEQNVLAGELALSPDVVEELAAATDGVKRAAGPNQDMYLTASESRTR
jgi:aryl-alcohol dehydrogenase-like predicted oxidoreductase